MNIGLKNILLTWGFCAFTCVLYGQLHGSVDVRVKFEPIQTIVIKNLSGERDHQEPLMVFSTSTYEVNIHTITKHSHWEDSDQIKEIPSLNTYMMSWHQKDKVIPPAPAHPEHPEHRGALEDTQHESTIFPGFTPLHSGLIETVSTIARVYTLSTK